MTPENMTTVLGSVRGYRMWSWYESRQQLVAMTSHHGYDPCTKVHVATCSLGEFLHRDQFIAPIESCTCGFYAVYRNLGPSIRHTVCTAQGIWYPANIERDARSPYLYGAVQLSGKVVFGANGVMRGEKMEIEALLAPPLTSHVKSAVTKAYKDVPCYLSSDVPSFEKLYPLDAPPFRSAAPWDPPIALGTPGGNS